MKNKTKETAKKIIVCYSREVGREVLRNNNRMKLAKLLERARVLYGK
jgi:hypothetical protein